jgi:lipopolysaccharide export system permease protein
MAHRFCRWPRTLTIVDRYFIAEIAKVFGAIMATLMLVMTSMLFLRTLEQVDVGSLASDSVLRFLGLQILRDTASLLPPAFFISALVTLGRMARDSELIAFNAGGLGPFRIYRSLLLLALPLALLTGWLSLVLQPYASSEIQQIEDLKNDQAAQVAGLQPGRFYQQDGGGVTFYAAELGEDRRFRDVFIQDRRQQAPRIVLGEVAYYRDRSGDQSAEEGSGVGRAVVLERGRSFDGAAGQLEFSIADFARYTYFIDSDAAAGEQRRRRAAVPTAQLLASTSLPDRAELGHRLAAPFAILSLAVLAIPLTALSPRQRSTGRLFLAFLAYFAFFNLQRLAETWMESAVTPPWMGVLWYQLLIILLVYSSLTPGSFWFRRARARLLSRLGWQSRANTRAILPPAI